MQQLEEYRRQLDSIDAELVNALVRRVELCSEIARYKQAQNIPMMQPHRVAYVKERCSEMGAARGLSKDFVRRLYELIISEMCRIEEEIIHQAERR